MKKSVLILAVLTLAMHHVHGRNLSAYFSFCTFNQPGKSPYIETYLNVTGKSVILSKDDQNNFQGKIEVQWIYTQDNKIVHFDKYNLLSPLITDTSKSTPDFIDQQRVLLPNGEYTLQLKITDKNSNEQSFSTTQKVSINYSKEKIIVSDIELLESFTPTVSAGAFSKSGYDLVPYVSNYFPVSATSLRFYAEIYNTKEVLGDDDFLVSYNISGHQNKSIINNLVSYKKQKTAAVNILLAELPIKDVTSGNYNLSIEVRDKSNQLLASKNILFQRSNPAQKMMTTDDLSTIKIENTFVSYFTNKDTLKDFIASLYPISSQFEVDVEENQLKYNNLESMQQFFYYFWSKRNAQDPEMAWLNYQVEVNSVNAEFSCPGRKGYDSDRGRVYLQYGRPNEITKNYYEGAAYPYEIWQYYKTEHESNVKFVFMTRNLTSNCFDLIHSTAKGEDYDANWLNRLRSESKSNAMRGDIDRGDDYSHRRVNNGRDLNRIKDEFDQPK